MSDAAALNKIESHTMELNPQLLANAPLGTAEKMTLVVAAVACFAVWKFVLAAAGLPSEIHISTLLLHQGVAGVIAVAVLMPVLTIVMTALLGRLRPEAGIFCVVLGLIALPTRGGDIRNALLNAGSYSIYLTMAIEQTVLWVIVGASLLLAERLGPTLGAKFTETEAGETNNDRLTVVFSQAAAVLILMVFVGQSPVKGQAMIGLALASFGATLAIHQSYRVAGAIWFVTGTMLAGFVAYVWGRFFVSGTDIGDVHGLLAGPARSLPLHYATTGVAGTIYGYWTSMTWQARKELPDGEI